MKTVLHYYDVFPKVLESRKNATVTIRPLGWHAAFLDTVVYTVTVVPMNETNRNDSERPYQVYELSPKNGTLTVNGYFGEEGQYALLVNPRTEQDKAPKDLNFRVYVVDPDLYRLRPYMGDLHVHSRRSDGHEAPEIVVANYRKAGFDFLALTDHEQYEPSLEAINAYKDAPIDLKLFPGEEVHPPENHTHYIHFGGNHSVNSLIRSDPDKYRAEVRQLAETLEPGEGINRKEYASAAWVSREIRKAGGLAVMVHPHWIHDNAYHIGEKMAVCMLKSKLFDAFEVIGGQTLLENQSQVSLWQDVRAEGCFVPPLGSSDSHGTVNATWFELAKTVVLAESCEYEALKAAIIAGRTVALEEYDGETFPRLYGLHRYVSYVQFLLEDYFPLHNELCVEEGRLMKAYVTGDAKAAASALKGLQGRCAALLKKYWK
ncbi:hypothetical protein FACS1894141_5160 [Spirochaetia bacterium]|nr:hypothetical protein FACS1894141_5160 [Spirochaetia bacterium]